MTGSIYESTVCKAEAPSRKGQMMEELYFQSTNKLQSPSTRKFHIHGFYPQFQIDRQDPIKACETRSAFYIPTLNAKPSRLILFPGERLPTVWLGESMTQSLGYIV